MQSPPPQVPLQHLQGYIVYSPSYVIAQNNTSSPIPGYSLPPLPSPPPSPWVADLFNKLNGIEGRLSGIDSKLRKLDILESNISDFEKEMGSIRNTLKNMKEVIAELHERTDGVEFNMAEVQSAIENLSTKLNDMEDDVLDVKSRSMTDNLVLLNMPEVEDKSAEEVFREFIED